MHFNLSIHLRFAAFTLCVNVVYAVISSCSNSMQFWCHQWSDFFATDTGVYATSEFAHITAKMLDKYKDQVRELKSKDEIITALPRSTL